MKNILIAFIAFSAMSLFAETNKIVKSSPDKLSVKEIVDKANVAAYYLGDNGRAKVDMVITDKQGRKRIRKFVIMRYDVKDGGEQKFYVYFEKPRRDSGRL
jgi:hypothetical protein